MEKRSRPTAERESEAVATMRERASGSLGSRRATSRTLELGGAPFTSRTYCLQQAIVERHVVTNVCHMLCDAYVRSKHVRDVFDGKPTRLGCKGACEHHHRSRFVLVKHATNLYVASRERERAGQQRGSHMQGCIGRHAANTSGWF